MGGGIVSDDTTGRTQFAMVPTWVYMTVTNSAALRLYVIISGKYANGERRAWPTEATLAADLGVTERYVRTSMKILEEAGAVVVIRTTSETGRRNHYWLPMDESNRNSGSGSMRNNSSGGSDQGKRAVSAGREDRSMRNNSSGSMRNNSSGKPYPPNQTTDEPDKPTVADAPAAPTAPAVDLFTSWPGSQDPDSEDQNQTPEDQNQNTAGSDHHDGRARDERDARVTHAGHVTAAWVDAFTAGRSGVQPTRSQRGRASQIARELLEAGNDADRVLEAARVAGAAGYPTIDRQLAMMTGPCTNGRNGHVPYQNPTDPSLYLEPIQ
jgi:hypothetical protein